MPTHDIDPAALIAALPFTFAGLAVVADRLWEDVDVTAITGAGVAIVGLALLAAIVVRQTSDPDDIGRSSPPDEDARLDATVALP